MQHTTITESFIDKILAINYASLPAQAIVVSKQVVLDGLAVMFAGATEPLGIGRISTAYVRNMGGAPQASVIAGGFKTSMQEAAYANGSMGHALDWDNHFTPSQHPMSPTLPAIIAIAENHQLLGSAVIEAVVTAFEVQAKVRAAATGLATGKGFHKPGLIGVFGATAGASKLLKLSREHMLMAFGLAGSRAGSLSINAGTMTKSSHAGHAARMGVECAVLAKMGWTANSDVFGAKGFFDAFMPGHFERELLIEKFGEPLHMLEPGVEFKKYPCNYQTHRPIDAAIALQKEFSIQPAEIDHVEIVFNALEYVNRPQPRSALDAKFSVQYTTAVALLDGEISMRSFSTERLRSPDIVNLLPRVCLRVDESIATQIDKAYTIVNIQLKDGRRLSNRVDKLTGSGGLPLTREERLRKFFSCTRGLLEDNIAQRLCELSERLDTLRNINEIMDIARRAEMPPNARTQ